MDLEPQVNVQPGQLLAGKYRVERLIGRGGMAAVFAAQHELLHQTVAVKLLLPQVAAVQGATTRFLNEARAAARIRSEHVTNVMDVGTLEDGSPYMVLEYLEGEDLDGYLARRGRVEAAEAVGYVLEALEAVAQAHALGIVHRDIKPSNLFLARRHDGTIVVKVLDFGISKAPRAAGDVSSTASQMLLGSPGYMSPEQARSAKSVDARTDVWSFGVLLYRLLTGEAPFYGENLTEVLMSIIEITPPAMSQLRPDVPAGLDPIVSRCLAKDREARYANVADLAVALAPFGGPDVKAGVARICRTVATTRTTQASEPPPAELGPKGTLVSPAGVALPPAGPAPAPVVSAVGGPRTASSWTDSRHSPVGKSSSRAWFWGALAGAVAIAGGAGALLALHKGPPHGASAVDAPLTSSAAGTPPGSEPAARTTALAPAVNLEPPASFASSSPGAASSAPEVAPIAVTALPVVHASTSARTPPSARPTSARPVASSKPAASGDDDVLNRRN